MNQRTFIVKVYQVEAHDGFIRFKLSPLNEVDEKDNLQKGRFFIIFDE